MKENNEYNDYNLQEVEEDLDEIEETQAGNNANSMFSKLGSEAVGKYANDVNDIIESKNKEYQSLKAVFGRNGALPADLDEDEDFEEDDE